MATQMMNPQMRSVHESEGKQESLVSWVYSPSKNFISF
jgi:hypothetical protein